MTSPTTRATTGLNASATIATAGGRHPPFQSGPAAFTRDYTTKEGAGALAGMIRDAWRKCGHDVPVHVEAVAPGNPKTTWTVRMPTLIGGLPR